MKRSLVAVVAGLLCIWGCSKQSAGGHGGSEGSAGLTGIAARAGTVGGGSGTGGRMTPNTGGSNAVGSGRGGRPNAGGAGAGGSYTGGSGKGGAGGNAMGGSGASGAGGSAGPGKWVGGYYPGYQRDLYPPEQIDFTAITHLFVGAGLPQTDGRLDMSLYIDATNGPALARQLVGLAHGAGRKAILMLGGAGAVDGFIAAAADARRATFVSNILGIVDNYGFDGVDLDWEPVTAADQPALRALTQALRDQRPDLIVTIPVGYLNANFETVSSFWVDLSSLVDQMNLMTYGMTGAWEGWQSWHSSALTGEGATTPTSVKSSIDKYLTAGVPAAKLGIGIGFFGVCYTSPVTGPKQDLRGATALGDDNNMSYANIIAAYYQEGARHYDDVAKVPYLSFQSGVGANRCTFVSYEDAQSIADKGAYVKQTGLGGAIIWTINEGHLSGAATGQRDPLLTAVRQAFVE